MTRQITLFKGLSFANDIEILVVFDNHFKRFDDLAS
jgi:hypothetical protein